jgi:hypothetical protein
MIGTLGIHLKFAVSEAVPIYTPSRHVKGLHATRKRRHVWIIQILPSLNNRSPRTPIYNWAIGNYRYTFVLLLYYSTSFASLYINITDMSLHNAAKQPLFALMPQSTGRKSVVRVGCSCWSATPMKGLAGRFYLPFYTAMAMAMQTMFYPKVPLLFFDALRWMMLDFVHGGCLVADH